jgi:hypothetical protein
MRRSIIIACGGLSLIGVVVTAQSPGPRSTQPASTLGVAKPADERTATEERLRADDQRLYAVLARMVPEAKFTQTPLEEVLTWLFDTQRINLHVEWTDLEDMGLPRDKPVSMSLRDLPAWRILRAALDQAGGSDVRLDYEVRDGVLRIATAGKLGREQVIRVYPVGDLLAAMAQRLQRLRAAGEAEEPEDNPAGALAKATDPNYRERKAAREIPGSQPAAPLAPVDETLIRMAQQRLSDLLYETLASDSWARAGGAGSFHFYNNALVVNQSRAVHRELERLLFDLRAAGGADPDSRPRPTGQTPGAP